MMVRVLKKKLIDEFKKKKDKKVNNLG